jgi:hypothetical protein
MKKITKILVTQHEGQQFRNVNTERLVVETGNLLKPKMVEFIFDHKTADATVVFTDQETGRQIKFNMSEMDRLHLHCDDSIYIEWGVEDFESRAAEIEEDQEMPKGSIYDRSKFLQALKAMEASHDACLGITWGEIDFFLDQMCLIKQHETSAEMPETDAKQP